MEERIRNWLQDQGYPLEMRTAAAFREPGFHVIQSDYYHDPETGDWRESDVIAEMSWRRTHPEGVPVRVMFVVECKTSRDKPWLLFTSNRKVIAGPAHVVQRASTPVGREWLKRISQRSDVQSLSLFRVSPTPAYGIVQAFRSQGGQDSTYAAALSAAKASRAMTQGITSRYASKVGWAILAFPMVVTEARLFNCSLDESNPSKLNIREAASGDLLWRNPVAGHPHTILKIINIAQLDLFVKQAAADATRLLQMTGAELNEVAKWFRDHRDPLEGDALFYGEQTPIRRPPNS